MLGILALGLQRFVTFSTLEGYGLTILGVSLLSSGPYLFVLARRKTDGLAWEVRTIIAAGGLEKLILVIPPLDTKDLVARWQLFCSWCDAFSAVPTETIAYDALLVRCANDGATVVGAADLDRRATTLRPSALP